MEHRNWWIDGALLALAAACAALAFWMAAQPPTA